jgi:hypothetical protein
MHDLTWADATEPLRWAPSARGQRCRSAGAVIRRHQPPRWTMLRARERRYRSARPLPPGDDDADPRGQLSGDTNHPDGRCSAPGNDDTDPLGPFRPGTMMPIRGAVVRRRPTTPDGRCSAPGNDDTAQMGPSPEDDDADPRVCCPATPNHPDGWTMLCARQ